MRLDKPKNVQCSILGKKDGKLWWYYYTEDFQMIPYTHQEMREWEHQQKELIFEIYTRVYNEAFNKGQ